MKQDGYEPEKSNTLHGQSAEQRESRVRRKPERFTGPKQEESEHSALRHCIDILKDLR